MQRHFLFYTLYRSYFDLITKYPNIIKSYYNLPLDDRWVQLIDQKANNSFQRPVLPSSSFTNQVTNTERSASNNTVRKKRKKKKSGREKRKKRERNKKMQQVSLFWPIVSFVTTDYKYSLRLEKVLAIKLKSCINLERRGALVCCHWSFRGLGEPTFKLVSD